MSSITEDFFNRFGQNSGYVRELYQLFLADPGLVSKSWADLFSGLGEGQVNGVHAPSYSNGANGHARAHGAAESYSSAPVDFGLQNKVARLVGAYRSFGHLKASVNPLSKGILPIPQSADLDIDSYNFSPADLASEVACAGFRGRSSMRLQDLIGELQEVYCGSVGYEYLHILKEEERQWLQERIEGYGSVSYDLSPGQKLRNLKSLVEAESFENELHKKYIGHKRFSLEGGETLMPILDTALQDAAAAGVKEAYIGMAHRGRLNVLVNTIGKPLEDVFGEFEDQSIYSVLGSGDVKYHLGYTATLKTESGSDLIVSLAPNPSHLEFVDPVLEGIVRARQDREYGRQRAGVLPVLIHGDAAFIGQGVVYETLNLSRVRGYRTGGTFHVVINNQIGFTTNPDDARSSVYCTDPAKAFEVPVFHVNCEDVEAACRVARIAIDFRMKFERDVVIDLYCYRKYGHNEGDDPSFTQPLSYSEIRAKKTAGRIYAGRLVSEGVIQEDYADGLYSAYTEKFNSAQGRKAPKIRGEACAMHGRLRVPTPETGVSADILNRVAGALLSVPEGFVIHPKLKQILEKRVDTLREGRGIDWGFAEALAFGSLLTEGKSVRLSGQDCGRGTFSHRHQALNNYSAPEIYWPLTRLCEGTKATYEVYNSTLSEAAVLGFEFGYSSVAPDALVMWEAQFGDFANGAQVIIDQFIVSCEAKWHQLSGVVMLLPHGFEGQGPEHSSARLERFLQLCAEGNIVVAYPASAAQYFHLMRRQGMMEIKRPLVVMTPKSLLRLPEAASTVSELTAGSFQMAIGEDFDLQGGESHVVMLSGKVYYDVAAELRKHKGINVKLIRVEQLYPFPQFEIKKLLKDMKIKSLIWAQEEPKNMGAWNYIEPYIRGKLGAEAIYVGREVGASPATGSTKRHTQEQQGIVKEIVRLVTEAK